MIPKLNKGFTLIELLVVIAVIGILSAIVLAALSSSRTKGQDTSIQSTLSSMRTQTEIYYVNTGDYGTTFAAIASPDNGCDAGGLAGTIFTLAASTQGSLLNMLTDLKLKAGTTNVACWVAPNSAGSLRVTTWAVAAKMKTNGANADYWCVDSAGASRKVTHLAPLDTPEEAINNATSLCN